MSEEADVLKASLRRLMTAQIALIAASAAIYFATKGGSNAVAALFGGAIALLNSAISALHLRRATAASSSAGGMAYLYIGAVIRFVATPGLVALGIWALKLNAVAIIVGFAVAQVGYFFNRASD